MTASSQNGAPSAEHREGRVVLGRLPQPLRNGSHDVVMCWEAVRRPVRVCEGGGWYSRHPTQTAWLMRYWMEHKGRPGWTFGPVADERDTDLDAMVAKAAASRARNYGFATAQGIETRQGEDPQELRAEHESPVAEGHAPEGHQP